MHHSCAALVLAQGEGPGGSIMTSLVSFMPIILIMVVFFWLMHRSQKKRDRQRREMLENIGPRDKVVTIGGVHGRVVSVKQDTFVLRVDDEKDIKITVSKSGVSRKADEGEGEAERLQ